MSIRTVRVPKDVMDYIGELEMRIRALETSHQIGNTSVDNGEFTVRNGDIVVRTDDDEEVTRIKHGDIPEIVMTPISTTGEDLEMKVFAWEDGDSGGALQLCVERPGTGQDGGKLLLMRDAAFLSHQPDGRLEGYLSIGYFQDELIYMQGAFGQDLGYSDTAFVCGRNVVAAGFGSFAYTYPAPLSNGVMVPVVQMTNTAGAIAGCLIAQSNSGWTYSWTGTLAKTINYWCFRVITP